MNTVARSQGVVPIIRLDVAPWRRYSLRCRWWTIQREEPSTNQAIHRIAWIIETARHERSAARAEAS